MLHRGFGPSIGEFRPGLDQKKPIAFCLTYPRGDAAIRDEMATRMFRDPICLVRGLLVTDDHFAHDTLDGARH